MNAAFTGNGGDAIGLARATRNTDIVLSGDVAAHRAGSKRYRMGHSDVFRIGFAVKITTGTRPCSPLPGRGLIDGQLTTWHGRDGQTGGVGGQTNRRFLAPVDSTAQMLLLRQRRHAAAPGDCPGEPKQCRASAIRLKTAFTEPHQAHGPVASTHGAMPVYHG